ncbi:MAG: DNA methyltransferase [Bacillota bacterium]
MQQVAMKLKNKRGKQTRTDKILQAILETGGKAQLKEIYEKLNAQGDEKNYIRTNIYRNLESYKTDNAKFRRVGKKGEGIYEISPQVFMAIDKKTNANSLIVHGDGRNMNMIEDNSIDAILTDHPWEDKKAHRAGNQKDFTNDYSDTTFKYNINDIRNKYRVLKQGRFCVEILPQKNGTNANYLRKVEQMFEQVGFEFYAEANWVKGELKPVRTMNGKIKKALETAQIYTGRTIKDNQKILFFTKGKPRKLRPYKAKIKKKFNKLLSKNQKIKDLMDEILDKESKSKINDSNFYNKSLKQIKYEEFSSKLNDVLKDKYLNEQYCMSGAREILPSRFIYRQVKEKIHQAEKPVQLYKEIINLITKKGEVILDSFAGAGGVAEAAMSIKRNSIVIEILKENIDKIINRLKAIDVTDILSEGAKNIKLPKLEKEQMKLF